MGPKATLPRKRIDGSPGFAVRKTRADRLETRMPDRLYDVIARSIREPLDGTLFERSAVELLRDAYYPKLRPVDGGNDAGMDGVGELPDGERFFLISTVDEDVRGNLRKNVKSHIDAGGELRTVVLATSREVRGRRRVELQGTLLDDFGVRLADVHDRGDFVQLLYGNPRWCKDLLGVAGIARALTRLPASRRPTPEIRLIGRDADLAELRGADGDLVISGKPGIGKTFLLERLMEEDWGLFDAGWSLDQLEAAVRELRPRRVVLDDAHLKGDRLAELRQLRREMNADFDLVAVSWPGELDEVAGALPGASTAVVRELERDQILEVIEEVGIVGPRSLQAHLVNQAMGRAGLAVTLAYACVRGNVQGVATGEALLQDIVGWFTRSLGQESRYVLGVLALAGKTGVTLRQVAYALRVDMPRVVHLVRGLANGGTVDEASRYDGVTRLRVQPESLRYALVRDVFFGGPVAMDVRDTIAQFDRPSIAVIPLVAAVHRGADVERAFLLEILDRSDREAVIAYALLGDNEAREALQVAPEHRAAIAQEAYRNGIDERQMLHLLMELAIDDNRSDGSFPEHPLRAVEDHLAAFEGNLEPRRIAVETADAWLREGREPSVAFKVLAKVVEPRVRRAYSDLGLGNTITIAEGPLPLETMAEMSSLWDSILNAIVRERGCEPGPVIDALHHWVFPGSIGFGRGVDDATSETFRSEARRVILRLADVLSGRPGVLRRLQHFSTWGALDVDISVPREFDILFPEDWDGSEQDGGHDGWAGRSDRRVQQLATEMLPLLPDEVAARIVQADAEALAAGITYPRLTPRVAQLLADGSANPSLLLTALTDRRAAGDIILPVLDRVVSGESEGWEDALKSLLDDPQLAWAAIQVALARPVGPSLKDAAIERMGPGHRNLIEMMVARDQLDPDTIGRLLDAPDPLVARDSAVAIGHSRSADRIDALPRATREHWRAIILDSPADEFWYSVILKRDPDLFGEWLKRWFDRLRSSSEEFILPHQLKESISDLPVGARVSLISSIPAELHSFLVQDAVTELVSDDLETADALLKRADLEELHWTVLRDGPSEAWMDRALMAVDRGWAPERIVAYTAFSENVWSGDESAHWQAKVDAFESLRQDGPAGSPRARLIAAGIDQFERQRDVAAEKERRERIFGDERA